VPTTAQHFVYELQQDRDRQETYQGVVDIMKAHTAYGGEQESTEQVNCIVSSVHQAGPLYPQLLTYRCGAANRRFGPILLQKSLAISVNGDSVALMRFAMEAIDDGAAQSRPR